MSTLFIVATPIGNLKDITLRAIETLQSADAVVCEDSRRTGLLLSHYQIKKPLLVLNDYNEARNIEEFLLRLQSGQNLALVSDAGTPLISDPGYKLVRACLEQNIEVDSLPGPSSVLTALTLSGLPPDKFTFLGYLPEKPGKRIKLLQIIQTTNSQLPTTNIMFVAPHKLLRTLEDMQEVYGNIEVVLAHELTKVHQYVIKKTVADWLEELKKHPPKGEYVLLFNLNAD